MAGGSGARWQFRMGRKNAACGGEECVKTVYRSCGDAEDLMVSGDGARGLPKKEVVLRIARQGPDGKA